MRQPLSASDQPDYHDRFLEDHLRVLFGELDVEARSLLRRHLQWVELPAGAALMTEGEAGDCMYLSIAGRLRASLRNGDGSERLLREMGRGEVIGEMALYTDEPRSATVVALRNSVLVRLDKAGFDALLASHPQVSLALTRQMVARLRATPSSTLQVRPVCIALVPVSEGVAASEIAKSLAAQMARLRPGGSGRIALVDAARIKAELGLPDAEPGSADGLEIGRRIASRLDELEATHDGVLLLADAAPTAWTRLCATHCDEILLLADAAAPPRLHATETACLIERSRRQGAAETLVLLHAAESPMPRGTRAWLARRPLAGHVHIRPALARDIARLARLVDCSAIGLVLAGGGARGLAHLGVMRALHEAGIEIDCLGGTSIGGVMAALGSFDKPIDEVTEVARRSFAKKPTGDFNLVPIVSLIGGRRLRRVIDGAVETLHRRSAADVDLEDQWKSLYVVASNYSQNREQVLRHGPLARALRASCAIPGALPPVVHEGDLLCDGGSFNNLPVDVMRQQRGIGRVIAVDLVTRKAPRLEFDEVPGPWALLLDRLRPRRKRRYTLPSLTGYLLNATVLYSKSREQETRRLADLFITPTLERVGMLAWHRFDSIVMQGHSHAKQVLDGLSAESKAAWRSD